MSTINAILQPILNKWLLPLGILITLFGYFGPWVNHQVAGLVVMGLDLGEYVKFLPPVRSGQISVWREGFYLPLITASLVSSLYAFAHKTTVDSSDEHSNQAEQQSIYHWLMRPLFIIVAIVAALNMLPPAWAPWKLRLPEFRLQTMLIIFCLILMLLSPFLALIPKRVRAIIATILAILSIWFPVSGFWRVLPTISELYNQEIWPGWGMYTMVIGLLLLLIGAWQTDKSIQPQAHTEPFIENTLSESKFSEEVV